MKTRKIISIILAIALVACTVPFVSASVDEQTVETEYTHEWDHECKTTCNGECGHNPVIIVPGIMQSQTYVQDADGNDIMTSDGFPIVEGMDMAFMMDTEALKVQLKDAVPNILKAILKRDRNELFDILMEILDSAFKDHYFNDDGTRINNVAVDEYWYSLAECKNQPDKSYMYAKGYSKNEDGSTKPTDKYKNQYDFIYRQVDISAYCEECGYDHAYYFSYPSFDNILNTAASLNEYIDMVKCQTGHDKVNLVFISLGGTIANVYLSKYIDKSEVDRIVFAACAIDGSYLLGDLMGGKTTLKDGNVLYNDLIPNIVSLVGEEYMSLAYLGNAVARAIPQEVFSDFLEEALQRGINEVIGKMIRNCQSMWALVPSEQYEELAALYISDESHAKLKAMTDEYYEIQKNAKATVQRLDAEGVDMFCIAGYNLQLPAAVEHYNLSADNIIQSSSTSIGGTFADCGKTLPKDYKPSMDASYINKDNTVDAGTCALPDKTWFVKNQSHLELQSAVNDVIGLCVALIRDHTITDARENNDGYTQFNEYRNLKTMESCFNTYYRGNYAGQNAEVDAALQEAAAVYAKHDWSAAEAKEAEQKLYTAMQKAGMLGKNADNPFVKYKLLPFLEKIAKALSKVFQFIFRGHDYWPLPFKLL